MARPRIDQLKQGLLLAFVAAGIILAGLNWGEALSGSSGGTKNFYRPTYVAPTAMPAATASPAGETAIPAPAATTTASPSAVPGARTPTATVTPILDDNG